MKTSAALALALALMLPAAVRAAASCSLPRQFVVSDQATPSLVQALRPGGTLAILAIGSARWFAPDGSPSSRGFPARMLAALKTALPRTQVSLHYAGGRDLAAAQMLPILRHALESRKVGLVIWQTGTVEAVENSPPEDFLAALAQGVSIVQQAGANLILVDPAFSRFLITDTNIDVYLRAFREVSIEPAVTLFPRFALTRYWLDQDLFDLESASASALPSLARARQDCIGQALANFILSSAGVEAGPHE